MRVALLSNVTVDLLADQLRHDVDIYVPAGFDTWQQEILSADSGLYEYGPESIVVLLYADGHENIWDCKENGEQLIMEWVNTFETLANRLPNIPVFVSSFHMAGDNCHYATEQRLNLYFAEFMNQQIHKLYDEGKRIYALPVDDLVYDIGKKAFYSPKMWYIGSMPYSIKGLTALSELIIQYLSASKGAKKKCIAVDLDNTLWGGVIGEDGIENIQLSNSKEGRRYKDAQRLLKQMKNQGVMLAILSKNNLEDVEPVFSHPDMLLKHEDFVAESINWDSKAGNIRQVAKDLNIGLDAFVFLDDNPAEREQMKAECPEVTVVEFPKDTSKLPEVLSQVYRQYFFRLDVTAEDAEKTAMYQAEKKRKTEFSASASPEDFLKNLHMKMDIHLMKPEELKRVVQLVNKTNQFNTTTRRYDQDQISAFNAQINADVIAVRMSDKYGDQGLVGVMIVKYAGNSAEIDTFLMSCRVMGRKAEIEIMAELKKYWLQKSIRTISASYIRSAKNAPVCRLYDKLGFSPADNSDVEIEVGAKCDYRIKTEDLPDTTGFFDCTDCFVS